ncbi:MULTISPECIES: hypothetical protein [unclassified Neochlamydia]|uniref:hypothetical protein n=1 Tax=unclassified Neochlamydia TaxID=2643326 RepID=UPI00140D9434|nr:MULTISPECIES: hypothetical protein [unclassified Neochlamydia]MBS4167095.1 hypothetical protein [Neochlamydia sp. AcF65]MBS4170242.1 hypothetical protein [Neochlamydia sp. AcF95]NGY95554.1 hypothetical protein [Neochlamydia sp. AcF84]
MSALEIASLVVKGLEIIPAATEIIRVCHKSDRLNTEEKLSITAEALFVFFRALEVGFQGTRLATSEKVDQFCKEIGVSADEIKIGLTLSSNFADVGRITCHKIGSNERLPIAMIDILAVAIFKVSETVDQISKLETLSAQTKEALSWVDTGGNLAATSLSMGVTSYRVYTNREKIFLATKLIFKYLAHIHQEPVVVEIKGKYEEDANKNAEILNAKNRQLLLRMIKWYNLEEIPSTFHKDPIFSQYICAISGKPIRRPVRALHGLGKTLYERTELYQWKAQHPHELPNHWPEDIPFVPQNMMSDKKIQKTIDARLEECASFFKIGLNTRRT